MEARRTRVVMVDDQVSYADAIGLALSITDDLELIGRARNGETAVEVCMASRPEIVLCDYRLPEGDTGTAVVSRLRALGFSAPVIILTGFLAPQVEREVKELPNTVALSKDTPISRILDAIRGIAAGAPLEAPPLKATKSILSKGELEVLELLNQGQSPADIARTCHLSLHTVRARIKSVHKKLDVNSQGAAIASATRLGLLVPPT